MGPEIPEHMHPLALLSDQQALIGASPNMSKINLVPGFFLDSGTDVKEKPLLKQLMSPLKIS